MATKYRSAEDIRAQKLSVYAPDLVIAEMLQEIAAQLAELNARERNKIPSEPLL